MLFLFLDEWLVRLLVGYPVLFASGAAFCNRLGYFNHLLLLVFYSNFYLSSEVDIEISAVTRQLKGGGEREG